MSGYKLILLCFCLAFCCLLGACTANQNQTSRLKDGAPVQLLDAKGFSIDTCGNKSALTIYNLKDSLNELAHFVLLPQSHNEPLTTNEIKVPCQRIICLSSTQLAYLIELDALDNVVGINSSRHLFNTNIKTEIEEGKVLQVGKEGVFDIEKIIALQPDVIFVSPFKTGGYDALRNLNIPLVPIAAYAENSPLGRAEWIKAMALFTGHNQKADSIYNYIRNDYNQLRQLTKDVAYRPSVFSGKMKGGAWYVAGGNSFFAHYFRDAGADYVIKDDRVGAIPMDYESLYNIAHDADYWRLLTSSPSGFNKKALAAEDHRYTVFKAFETGNVLTCNLREVPYREESCIKPNVLLADYISHFHPDLLPNYQPTYWKRINE
ncbi:ABC transporter substrate-binding protein [Carboxylicivirga sp. N1Y90]|uniref:ABC transporter substrate-binding protein n=1 Tax=Carboxylicivirga fragile TaxID=3417571 RepID=UPI003D32ABD1|nr:ABC transporter substrate-binding protein [Marinilabiliaceae bacterium N1Y90]